MSEKKATKRSISSKGSLMDDAIALPEKKMYTSWPDMIRHWPKTTFCIVANEFCERFSYYGMRTVLILYLLNVLKFTDNQSTIFFNSFTVLCFVTPLLGSIIADGYIGKFWTIFSVSILYAGGQVILAVASTKNFESSVHPWMDLAGLIIIGFGTGGIKPCVSAFGADQFDLGQERMLSLFFSVFYFSINAGSMISSFITPIFRSQPCMGQDSCYPLAFGVPAALMVVATIVFMLGSFWYKRPPPKENVFGEVYRVMTRSIRNKWRAPSGTKKSSFLDYYLTTHDCDKDSKCLELRATKNNKTLCQKASFIDDIKSLLHVMIMFLPVPMFWALYDQQGSIWLIQGIQMDCRLWGNTLLLPDQMQTINAVLILVFIPLFQVIVYPLAEKCFVVSPLRKMVAGGLLASLAFLVTGFVQIAVNKTLPQLPGSSQAYVSFWNQIDGNCVMNVTDINTHSSFLVPSNFALYDDKGKNEQTFHVSFGKNTPKGNATFSIIYSTGCKADNLPTQYTMNLEEKKVYYIAASSQGLYHSKIDMDKPQQGTGEFSISIVTATKQAYAGNLVFCRWGTKSYNSTFPCNARSPSDFYFWETDYNSHTDDRDGYASITDKTGAVNNGTVYAFKAVKPGDWGLYLLHNTPKDVDHQTYAQDKVNVSYLNVNLTIKAQGGVYVMALTGDLLPDAQRQYHPQRRLFQIVQSNTVSILWQLPQYVIITAAEILFSITGYEFAYSQSAPSMKALVQAIWLLTIAVGDTIIVIITIINPFSNIATQFFVYAGVMALVIFIFALISIFYYEYHYYTADEKDPLTNGEDEEDDGSESNDSLSIDNKAFINEDEDEKEASKWGDVRM